MLIAIDILKLDIRRVGRMGDNISERWYENLEGY